MFLGRALPENCEWSCLPKTVKYLHNTIFVICNLTTNFTWIKCNLAYTYAQPLLSHNREIMSRWFRKLMYFSTMSPKPILFGMMIYVLTLQSQVSPRGYYIIVMYLNKSHLVDWVCCSDIPTILCKYITCSLEYFGYVSFQDKEEVI